MAGAVARVLLETPLPQLDRLLDYRIPAELDEIAQPGVRITAPLGRGHRIVDGFLVERVAVPEYEGRLSELDGVVSSVPVLTGDVWALVRRVADRQAGSAADVLRSAVPPRHVRAEKAWLARSSPVDLTAGFAAPEECLRGYPDGCLEKVIADGSRVALTALPHPVADGDSTDIGHWAFTLAELAAATLKSGRTAVLCVPAHREQDQLTAALGRLVPADTVLRVDARQSKEQRYGAFLAGLEQRPRIVVGNRNAVYAPAYRLGLIVLWDDGDPLYAEPLAPYAHARDVALMRQDRQGCALVFAAHARSLACQRLVESGWLAELDPRPLVTPRVVVTELQHNVEESVGARIPSSAWRLARDGLESGPVLVQVARPGYAPVVACARCRAVARCPRCTGPLGLSAAEAPPSCAWCGALAAGWRCPECAGTSLRLVGVGAARTADELGAAFRGARIIVADGERRVLTVSSRPSLVVATPGAEPRADGGYRAVLLLDAGRMLTRESLRVAEDGLRVWSNAAALAAPGAPTALVGVSGPVATALATWRQHTFAARELEDRRRLRFPPAVRIATVTGNASAVERATDGLDPALYLDILGPAAIDDEQVRAIVRFDYRSGPELAASLRAAVLASTPPARRPPGRGRSRPALRIRLDDPDIF